MTWIRVVLVIALGCTAMLLTACHTRERMCPHGQYVARSAEYPKTGRLCVRDGHNPPQGWQRYPAGQAPTYVDQDR